MEVEPKNLSGLHIEQTFMIEIFAGAAVLCSVAKQFGLHGSIAVDKTRKKAARSAIFPLDLTLESDRALLECWLQSPLLVWIHLAPVCGTASKARNIRRFPGDPAPLRSSEWPEGLSDLTDHDNRRVQIANSLFEFSCRIFASASRLGVLVTMENPKNSFFWITKWAISLMLEVDLWCTDFQVCMLGGDRDKWTKIVANFDEITQMDISCDKSHPHAAWGFARDNEGNKTWATSLESQYPRKMCVCLTHIVLQRLQKQGLTLQSESLKDLGYHPLKAAQIHQMSAGVQVRKNRLPPLVPDFANIIKCRVSQLSHIPCSLMSKLPRDVSVRSEMQLPLTLPKGSRFLRFNQLPAIQRGQLGQPVEIEALMSESKLQDQEEPWMLEAVFGAPWTCEAFIQKACESGHPLHIRKCLPKELMDVAHQHVEWSHEQLGRYRIEWCKRWLRRSKELEAAEASSWASRDEHVKVATKQKRVVLTAEMLEEIGYEDVAALELLNKGATLAGEVESSRAFQSCYKPCLTTVQQLEQGSQKRNELILSMTRSSGDTEIDRQLLDETEEEIRKGWAIGPFELSDLQPGSVVSRRFPLQQSTKTRMIDDFSISGINDSTVCHHKVDLHTVDSFCALVREYFEASERSNIDSRLVGKTYDLKSAYRQVPIRKDHLRFAFFSVFNHKENRPQIYQLLTLPFGATHSVYNFLRLSRMIYMLAVKGLALITTNFYDDYILATHPALSESSKNAMEFLFIITGWKFAQEGSKATEFNTVCKALGVEFNLNLSGEKTMLVSNTAQRIQDLQQQISYAVEKGFLSRQETLVLRGRFGFANSFLHGRLGNLLLKQLVEHAYGSRQELDAALKYSLNLMAKRLSEGQPRKIGSTLICTNYLYTDASYEQESFTGGLGGVLVDEQGVCIAWFGLQLNQTVCKFLNPECKETIIYELELAATVLATKLWLTKLSSGIHVVFGDNDGVRYSLIRGTAVGKIATQLLEYHIRNEALANLSSWYARVRTESNISDFPSRGVKHHLLGDSCEVSLDAASVWTSILDLLNCEQAMS